MANVEEFREKAENIVGTLNEILENHGQDTAKAFSEPTDPRAPHFTFVIEAENPLSDAAREECEDWIPTELEDASFEHFEPRKGRDEGHEYRIGSGLY